MSRRKDKSNWVIKNWVCQIIFFSLTSLFFFKSVVSGTQGDAAWWYYLCSITVIIANSIGTVLTIPLAKHIISMTTIMINIFMIPLVLVNSGYSLGFSAGFGLIFIMSTISITPYYVGASAAVTGIIFSIYLHQENNVFFTPPYPEQTDTTEQNGSDMSLPSPESIVYYKVVKAKTTFSELSELHFGSDKFAIQIYEANKEKLGDTPNIDILKNTELIIPAVKIFSYKTPSIIMFIYITAGLLGLGWKFFAINMFELCSTASVNKSKGYEDEILNLKDELEQTNNNCKVLKEEVAIQIIELNHITGHHKE